MNSVRLLTNNPEKLAGLQGYGIEVAERIAALDRSDRAQRAYLRTKRVRMGHHLPDENGEL